MAERKAISKSLRFEVFKRDSFTCQYCGRMAPDVLLEIDHIMPVAKGGTNDLLNLVTSCADCNRGKGKKTLSDSSTIKNQQKQLKELAEKREQIKMVMEWKNELLELEEEQVDAIDELVQSFTQGQINISDSGRQDVKKWLKSFGFNCVYESTKLALDQYLTCDVYNGEVKYNLRSCRKAIDYIPGICRNKKEDPTDQFLKDLNYLVKILSNRFGRLTSTDYWQCKERIKKALRFADSFDQIKRIASSCNSIYDFKQRMDE